MTTQGEAGPEPTLVLQDTEGNYYMIPMKHMEANLVQPDRVDDLRRQLEGAQSTDEDQETAGFILSSASVASIQPVGIYAVNRDLRRTYVPLRVSPIPGLNISSPPS
jgi:hypothetical protein